MNWSQLPSLSALRAFCAFVQRGSVADAGAALNVSHAAISQQLRALETHLGTPLFDRSNRALELTPEGQDLARALEDGFGRIAAGVEALSHTEAHRPLNIGCTPTFASAWLMPRLAGFQADHPGIDMVMSPSPSLVDPAPGGIDVAIRYGTGDWKGLDSVELMASPVVVVGAPALFKGDTPKTPADLIRYPWLEELGTHESSSWLAGQGLQNERVLSRTEVPGNLMIDGARNGQGIAVTTRIAVAEDIEAGRLVAVFEERRDAGYHLVTKPGVHRPPLKAFLRWILREVRKT
ncbi:LysR family transcriptional regulator [Marivita sp. S6314]|nr:LysR family transcriptional regulator [Marivita sp. S6314]MCK0149884.1 LysR family transcriptional regulator [Marivita sp. S6314]